MQNYNYLCTYPLDVLKVKPTVYLASWRAQENLFRFSAVQHPLSLTRSSEGFTSTKIGINFLFDSIISDNSCKQKYESQYRGDKTDIPSLHCRTAVSILSNSLSPGFIFLLSKKGRNPSLERWSYNNPATLSFVSMPRWLMKMSHGDDGPPTIGRSWLRWWRIRLQMFLQVDDE